MLVRKGLYRVRVEWFTMAAQIELDALGHRLFAKAFNEDKKGTPVVFMHGITASINFWEPIQVPIFRERFRWYSLSLPGHYPATLPPDFQTESLTGKMVIEVLGEAIRKLTGEKPAILAGHSTGGFAAVGIAGRYPDLVAGMISISGFVQGRWKGALGLLQILASLGPLGPWLFRTSFRALLSQHSIYRLAASLYAKDRRALYSYPNFDSIFDAVYRDAQKIRADNIFHYFKRLPEINISNVLHLISVPTLVISGDSDPIVPTNQSCIISDKVQKSELYILKGAGHLPMYERAKEYNAVIKNWVGKHPFE